MLQPLWRRKRRFPSGPANWLSPLGLTVRHALAFYRSPLKFARRLRDKYGDLVHYRYFWRSVYQINHPRLVRELLVEHHDRIVRLPFLMKLVGRVMGESVLTMEGEAWRKRRQRLRVAFLPRHLDYAGRVAAECSQAFADSWCGGGERDALHSASTLTLQVFVQSMFGCALADDDAQQLVAASQRFSLDAARAFRNPLRVIRPASLIRHKHQQDGRRLLEEIGTSVLQPSMPTHPASLVSLLTAPTDSTGQAPISQEDAVNEARTLIFAGHHTLASALAWTMRCLAANPEVQRRVSDEAAAVNAARLGREHLSALPYLQQVINESMRLYTPAWGLFTREVCEPLELDGYTLSPGSIVNILPSVIHTDPRFFPSPDSFLPDRFGPANSIPQGAFMPFGIGPRACLGAALSHVEMPIVLATLLRQGRLELLDPQQPPPRQALALGMYPETPIRLRLVRHVAARRAA